MLAPPPAPTYLRRVRRVRTLSLLLLVLFGAPALMAVIRAVGG